MEVKLGKHFPPLMAMKQYKEDFIVYIIFPAICHKQKQIQGNGWD